ncbi:MAG: glycosyltransferase [Candidatus Aminicenantes bacterium]|nr:glycosyltransferase [Candidatus Aminicenantes bacterium]
MKTKEFLRCLKKELAKSGDEADQAIAMALCRHVRADLNPKDTARLHVIFRRIARQRGSLYVFNLLKRLEVSLSLRKPSLAVYDHTLHLIGGAQKYGCTLAQALQDDFDITLITNKPVGHQHLKDWYQLDLSCCRIKTMPIPFYEAGKKEHLDPAAITSRRMANPFHLISRESGRYDFFVNNSMVEMVFPMADPSFFICHFPERRPASYFYVDRYRHLIYNSRYTAEWIEKKWHLRPGIHLYPPVDMHGGPAGISKEKIILSAARFDPGGNKQQLRMVKIFAELSARRPRLFGDWRLVLAGGSPKENPYLRRVRQAVTETNLPNVELQVNISAAELMDLYQRSKIFWHLCGLDRTEPELIEHFGMTTAEAMQNGCVPVVFAGGGLVEIVENNVSGLLFSNKAELVRQTLRLVQESQMLLNMGEKARRRGAVFSRGVFTGRARELFAAMLKEYRMEA